MPLNIRTSKYRHVYGSPFKETKCYKNLRITRNAHDTNLCAVNPKFIAIVTETIGGGSFITLDLNETGRVPVDHPKVTGHTSPVADIKWNPFNMNQIASSSDDNTVKLWNIPDNGLITDLNKCLADLKGHSRRVAYIEWHPLAENIIASSGFDRNVMIWNINNCTNASSFNPFPEIPMSISWSYDGRLLVSSCRDRMIRVLDPRIPTVVSETMGHSGSKSSKVFFLNDQYSIFSCGFSKHSSRQMGLWDLRDMSEALAMDMVDHGSGIFIPYYDPDTNIVYLIGKGDGNFRYYEIMSSEPYFYFLSEFKSLHPQRGYGAMPKLGLDTSKNEIARFYKLYATGDVCEPISMIVPRKSEQFQADIYPDTSGTFPSMTSEEWLNGENKAPILVSLNDRQPAIDVDQTKNKEVVSNHIKLQQQKEEKGTIPVAEKPLRRPNQSSSVVGRSASLLYGKKSVTAKIEPMFERKSTMESIRLLENRRMQNFSMNVTEDRTAGHNRNTINDPYMYRIEISIPLNQQYSGCTDDQLLNEKMQRVDETPFKTVQELSQELNTRSRLGSSPIKRIQKPKLLSFMKSGDVNNIPNQTNMKENNVQSTCADAAVLAPSQNDKPKNQKFTQRVEVSVNKKDDDLIKELVTMQQNDLSISDDLMQKIRCHDEKIKVLEEKLDMICSMIKF